MDSAYYIGNLSFATGWEYASVIYKVPAQYAAYYTHRTFTYGGRTRTNTYVDHVLIQAEYYTYRVNTNKNPIQVTIHNSPSGTTMLEVVHTHPYYNDGYRYNKF